MAKQSVLLVDDDLPVLNMLKGYLEKDFGVTIASNLE